MTLTISAKYVLLKFKFLPSFKRFEPVSDANILITNYVFCMLMPFWA